MNIYNNNIKNTEKYAGGGAKLIDDFYKAYSEGVEIQKALEEMAGQLRNAVSLSGINSARLLGDPSLLAKKHNLEVISDEIIALNQILRGVEPNLAARVPNVAEENNINKAGREQAATSSLTN